MAILNVSVEPSDLDDSGWESGLNNAKRPTVDVYARAFNNLSKERQAQGKNEQAVALALLSVICSFALAPGRDDGPYAPVMSGPSGRSELPEDLSETELDVVAYLFPRVGDSELRARLGDLLWLRKGDYKAGQAGVTAYLAAAQELENKCEYFHVPVRIERAVQIAAQLGGGRGELLRHVLEVLGSIIRDRAKSTVTLRTPDLIDILIDRDDDNMAEWAALSEQLANELEKTPDYHLALMFWARAAQAHRKAGNNGASRNALIQEAEAYVHLADDAPSQMVKASFIRSAFEAYRQIPDTQKRRNELHERLLQHQEESLREMGRSSTPLNLGETPQRAREAVKGQDLIQGPLLPRHSRIIPNQLKEGDHGVGPRYVSVISAFSSQKIVFCGLSASLSLPKSPP
jgi:hypothetical protein